MNRKDLFKLLVKDYWENIQGLNAKTFAGLKEQWFEALIHLKNYAYERNVSGAASVYREIADKALGNKALGNLETRKNWSGDLEKRVWDNFKNECKKRKILPNKKVNPLRPSNPSNDEKRSIVKFVWDINNDRTVAAWAFRMISENKIKEAHDKLKTIWGVGDKIASFYLRDIFWLGHELEPKSENTLDNLHLLQPVDIWIERAAKALGHHNNSKESIAEFICSFEKENDLPIGGGNIGFWMLGSQYVDSDEFEEVVKSITHKSQNASKHALIVAERFEDYYGRFGKILKDIILA